MRGLLRPLGGALAVLGLSACPPPAPTPLPQTGGGARPACSEAWAALPPAQRDYDFASDERRDGRGNTGYASYADRVKRPACEKEWTVLVYMQADYPGMPPWALWNLYQMEAAFPEPGPSAASGPDADVVVQLDVSEPPGIRRLHLFRAPVPFVPLTVSPDQAEQPADGHPRTADALRSPIVEWLDEESPATTPPAKSLEQFLTWGIARYPARHYLAIVWGHGFGWRARDPAPAPGAVVDELKGGIAPDRSGPSILDIPGLHDALAATRRANGGRPLDLYVSDACLMQSVEVVRELGDTARYVAGSEAKIDPLGLPYRLLMPLLNGTEPAAAAAPPAGDRCAGLPDEPACRVATRLPALTLGAFAPASPLYGPQAAALIGRAHTHLTYSALDTSAVDAGLQPALHRVGLALAAYLGEAGRREERQQDLFDILYPHAPSAVRVRSAYAFPGGARDLGSFLGFLRAAVDIEVKRLPPGTPSPTVAPLRLAIADAEAALGKSVLAYSLGDRYADPAYAGSAGLSVWLPTAPDNFTANIDRFATAQFYQPEKPGPSPWRAWLDSLFAPPQ